MRICAVMEDGKRYQIDVDEDDLFIAVRKAIQKFREQGIPANQVRAYITVQGDEVFNDESVRERKKRRPKRYCAKCGGLIVGKSKRGEVNEKTGLRGWICENCADLPNCMAIPPIARAGVLLPLCDEYLSVSLDDPGGYDDHVFSSLLYG